jgi:hypothetical protein
MNTQASTWFKDTAEFLQLCGDAQSMAKGEKAEEFAFQMMRKANEHGLQMYLSYSQLKWLCDLADVDPPTPVERQAPAPYRL